jgi:hypothetical protein
MEQNVRDSRISMLYEGTTGIQALDLLGRKVLMTQGRSAERLHQDRSQVLPEQRNSKPSKNSLHRWRSLNKEWGELTMKVGMAAMNREEVGARLRGLT